MIRELIEAIPFAVAAIVVVALALWLNMSYGPVSVIGGVVAVFAIVIGRAVWVRRRFRDND